jgi:PTS system nitrogen regulatory IIA component
MKIHLSKDMVFLRLKGREKNDIINELLDRLSESGKLPDRQAAYNAVMEREAKMSTGLKNGIAIPHGKTNTVDKLVACLGVSDHPVIFDSQDGEPSRLFIMTISKPGITGPHLEFLAEINNLLKSEDRRRAVLDAADPEEALRIMES